MNDLLAVINAWGACDYGPSGNQRYICRADIEPPGACGGDGAVNVNDLLAVINAWGPCGGFGGGAPESVEDCETECDRLYPEHGTGYAACVAECVRALCEAGVLDPEDCPD